MKVIGLVERGGSFRHCCAVPISPRRVSSLIRFDGQRRVVGSSVLSAATNFALARRRRFDARVLEPGRLRAHPGNVCHFAPHFDQSSVCVFGSFFVARHSWRNPSPAKLAGVLRITGVLVTMASHSPARSTPLP